ncbi:MAG: DUF4163 domain-containing protein, partial [Bacteroidaceae bacterium]|nr:DUF4163 domain-containing protein [Bacteroidaceae bacterium]
MKQKKHLRYSIFPLWMFGVICCLFAACESAPREVTFERKTVSDSLTLSRGKKESTCWYNINFAYVKETEGDTVAPRINRELVRKVLGMDTPLSPTEAVDLYVDDLLTEYRSVITTLYMQGTESEKDDTHAWLNYEIDIQTQTDVARQGKVVNYVADHSSYMGGAHPHIFARWLNFDMKTGYLLTLEEIMIPDYEPKLLEALAYELQVKCNAESMEGVRDAGYLNWSELYVPDNFLIKDEG